MPFKPEGPGYEYSACSAYQNIELIWTIVIESPSQLSSFLYGVSKLEVFYVELIRAAF